MYFAFVDAPCCIGLQMCTMVYILHRLNNNTLLDLLSVFELSHLLRYYDVLLQVLLDSTCLKYSAL